MSKAFTKEVDDLPEEHSGRHRSSSGLPPGAVNYMTEEGARRLRKELAHARGRRAEDLRHILESATVVPEHEGAPKEALFGITVTVRQPDGAEEIYRIVGAEETGLAPGWVSWVSPIARALLGARVGHRVHLPDAPPKENAQVVKLAL